MVLQAKRPTLDDILAAWRQETPVPEEIQRQVESELDDVGLTGLPGDGDNRHDVELALRASHWLGSAVLRRATAPAVTTIPGRACPD